MAVDTIWAGAQEVLALLAALAVLGVLVVGLGPEQFGQFSAVQVLASTLSTLCTTWVTLVMFQHVRQMGMPLQESFSRAIGYLMASAVVALLVALGVAIVALSAIPLDVTMAMVVGEIVAVCLIQVVSGVAQMEAGVPTATRLRMWLVGGRLLAIVAIGVIGIVALRPVAYTIFGTYVAVGVGVFVYGVRRFGLRVRPSALRTSDLSLGGLHLGVLSALAVQENSDKILMVRLAPAVDAGIYAAAFRIASLGLVPIRALLNANHLRFLDDSAATSMQHTRRALRYSTVTVAYGVVAGCVMALLAGPVTSLLGPAYDGTAPVIQALSVVLVLKGMSQVPVSALLGVQRFGRRLAATAVSAAVAVTGYIVLIPLYSYWGAVVATLIAEAVLVVVVWTALIVSDVQRDRSRRLDNSDDVSTARPRS